MYWLVESRKKKNLSSDDLAESIGKTASAVRGWEANHRIPTGDPDLIHTLSTLLEVPVAAILLYEGYKLDTIRFNPALFHLHEWIDSLLSNGNPDDIAKWQRIVEYFWSEISPEKSIIQAQEKSEQ